MTPLEKCYALSRWLMEVRIEPKSCVAAFRGWRVDARECSSQTSIPRVVALKSGKRMGSLTEGMLNGWYVYGGFASFTLTVLGVLCGVMSFLANNELNLRKDTAFALKAKAQEEVRQLERLKLETANRVAEEARRRATQLERLEEERKERERPRHFEAQQRSRLIEYLTNGPKGKILMASISANEESVTFAGEMSSALEAAGFEIIEWRGDHFPRFTVKGQWVCLRGPTTIPSHAQHVLDSFASVGTKVDFYIDPKIFECARTGVSDDTLLMVVGAKP